MSEEIKCDSCELTFKQFVPMPINLCHTFGTTMFQDAICPNCEYTNRWNTTWLPDPIDFRFSAAADFGMHNVRNLDANSECAAGPTRVYQLNMYGVECLALFPHWVCGEQLYRLPEYQTAAGPSEDDNASHAIMNGRHSVGSKMAVESLLSAMILGAWTAFEVLAEDLWIASVNSCSRCTLLDGNAMRIQKMSPGKSEKQRQKTSSESKADKRINLDDLKRFSRNTFNLSGRMGSFYVETERVGFASIKTIRRAYSEAFSDRAGLPTANIDESLASDGLYAASLIRNLLIHRNGVADSEYVAKARCSQKAPGLAIGDRLQLNGAITSSVVGAVVESACKLIKGVDLWLTLNANSGNADHGTGAKTEP